MLAPDTDHLTAFGYSSVLSRRLKERLAQSGQDVVTTAVNCEEQMKGLLAAIHRERDAAKQIIGYSDFVSRLEFLAGFTILPWDSDSAKLFAQHQRLHIKGSACAAGRWI